MKKIFLLSGIVLLTVFITSCNNPFWPFINFGVDPQEPVITGTNPHIDAAPEGVKYFQDAAIVHDLYVTASSPDGGTLTYQWYSYHENDPEDITEIPAATSSSFKPPVSEIGETIYYVVVTNNLGGKTASKTSNHAKVIVTTRILIGEYDLIEADIFITPPIKGELQDTNATGYDEEKIELVSVVWSSQDGILDPAEAFHPITEYTVAITLLAKDPYKFGDVHYLLNPSINGHLLSTEDLFVSEDKKTLTLTFTFDPTLAQSVTGIAIETQPARLTYHHEEELDLTGLSVTLIYEGGNHDVLHLEDFGTYITTNPLHGAELTIAAHNNEPVVVSYGHLSANTNNLTVSEAPIMDVALTVTVPVPGAAPNLDAGGGTGHFSKSAVTWSPAHNPFHSGTEYTAYITLTADENYTFAGGLADVTINGEEANVTDNTGNTVVIYQMFTTSARFITGFSVLTQPELVYNHGGRLDLSDLVVRISYNEGLPDDIGFDDFLENNITTAPVNDTLLSRSTHHNQTVTVSYETYQDETEALTVNAAPISHASINITPPDIGYPPDTDATGLGYFSAEVAWDPVHSTFEAGETYTVNITLTANENYAFTGGFTSLINGTNATVSNNLGNTVIVSFIFPELSASAVSSISVKNQPATLTYSHGGILDLTGLVVTLNYADETPPLDVPFADFMGVITTNPPHGADLTHIAHDDTPIVVSRGHLTPVNTNPLTVNKIALDITHASHIKIYDGTTNAIGVTVTLDGVIDADSPHDVKALAVTAAYTNAAAGTNTINITGVTLTSDDDDTWKNYTVAPKNGLTVSHIGQRAVSITPNAGQSRVYGTTDPAFTFTPSETIIGGNSQSGSLGRAAGGNVGSYAINIGTLSWGDNYALSLSTPPVNFSITQAVVTITPDSGQIKIIGASDPVLTFTASEPIIGGNSQTGALERAAGETADNYAINIGTLSWGPNYQLVLSSPTVYFEISSKEEGAQASTPVLSSTHDSITIESAGLTGNSEQEIEYVLSLSSTPPAVGWQDIGDLPYTIPTTLSPGTQYYVHTRAKASANYLTGDSSSASIFTDKAAGATVGNLTFSSTDTSIKIETAELSASGQIIEYAYNTTGEPPADGDWHDIDGALPYTIPAALTPGTQYYVYARAKGNNHYLTGDTIGPQTVSTTQGGGATISTLTLSSTYNSITIDAYTLSSATGQTIEYVLNASSTPPVDGWNDIGNLPYSATLTPSSPLSPGTQYYIHTRAKGNTSYVVGATRTDPISTKLAAGASVSTITLSSTHNSIRIDAFTLSSATGQSIQYILNQSSTQPDANSAEWAAIGTLPFTIGSSLLSGAQYYVHTRTMENTGYLTGTGIKTDPISTAKAAGASVSTLTLSSTHNSITITAAALSSATGQSIQYVLNNSSTPPAANSADWNDNVIIGTIPFIIPTTLSQGTQYYVHARARESTSHLAGTTIRTESIWTAVNTPTNITIVFNPLTGNPANALQPPAVPVSVTRGSSVSTTINIPSEGFTKIQWYINGNPVPHTGATQWQYILSGTQFNNFQFHPQNNTLSVEVDDIYSLVIPFTAVNP